MARASRLMLAFTLWPIRDRTRWEAAFKSVDRFDEGGHGAHLAASTRQVLQESYGRFLGFLSSDHPDRLAHAPKQRINRELVAAYVAWRRPSCSDRSIAFDLDHLRQAYKLVCPASDWSWLRLITKRLVALAPPRPKKHHLITSERIYALGLDLMDAAMADAAKARCLYLSQALQYRDGLLIAFLAQVPVRSRTLTAICVGQQLLKVGARWELEIPASDVKNRRPLDFGFSDEMSARIDLYLELFRNRIPGADKHASLWSSKQSRPMCAGAISHMVHRRTKKAFGFSVNLHRFRHAAATFWSIHDPANVRGVKDLLGHASFDQTDAHYIITQSRLAGRTLADAVDNLRK